MWDEPTVTVSGEVLWKRKKEEFPERVSGDTGGMGEEGSLGNGMVRSVTAGGCGRQGEIGGSEAKWK